MQAVKSSDCLETMVPPSVRAQLSDGENDWLQATFTRFGGRYPTLEQIWGLMDETWCEYGCDPDVMDERISAFYSHPVWLLNGLFIEQHAQSLENRRQFADWVRQMAPGRVADFGGGFGGLARIIGEICPQTIVEVIEPHPRPAAIALAEETKNVRYCAHLTGEYDLLIATDVFEHVHDPLALAAETTRSLRQGGKYLMANCFSPVIRCHLPQTFHFRHSWDAAMQAMGLKPQEALVYGRTFVYQGQLDLDAARVVEHKSKQVFRWTAHLPGRVARPLTRLLCQQ